MLYKYYDAIFTRRMFENLIDSIISEYNNLKSRGVDLTGKIGSWSGYFWKQFFWVLCSLQKNGRFIIIDGNKNQNIAGSFKLAQSFGSGQSCEVEEDDVISALKFDPTGNFLCLGDKAGRIIIFSANNACKSSKDAFDYYAEFQSHVRQFDPLKGVEYLEEVIDICWLRPQGRFLKLLTTNSKSIKLWKAFEKVDRKILKNANKELSMPKLESQGPAFTASEQFIFPSVHSSQINSISYSSNQQYLLSGDKERAYLWNLQKPVKPYVINSIEDQKKDNSDLGFTCTRMHPSSDNIFGYGLNRSEQGLGVCDTRVSSDNGKAMGFGSEIRSTKNFFTDIIGSISSIEFTPNGKYLISRDYLNVKLWDLTNCRKPLLNICVQESVKSKLVNLYEADCINDKFTVACSKDGSTLATGTYNNCFHILNLANASNCQYELNFKKSTICRPINPGKCPPILNLDSRRKTSVMAYHPTNHSIATASLNCLFIYSL